MVVLLIPHTVVRRNLSDDVRAYVDILYKKLLKISVDAKKDVQPVKIGYEKGECKMNINRRAVFSEGEVWLGRNPDGACDHDLDIIKFTDTHGALRAVHVNYPCHGTCTGPKNYRLSGDWPGISAKIDERKARRGCDYYGNCRSLGRHKSHLWSK